MDSYKDNKIKELRTLKGFFEKCEQSSKEDSVAGHFGCGYSVFFGNAIQYNSFVIPYSAMRLIYKANKEQINAVLESANLI